MERNEKEERIRIVKRKSRKEGGIRRGTTRARRQENRAVSPIVQIIKYKCKLKKDFVGLGDKRSLQQDTKTRKYEEKCHTMRDKKARGG